MNRLYHSQRAAAAGWPHSFRAKHSGAQDSNIAATRQQDRNKTAARQRHDSKKAAKSQQQDSNNKKAPGAKPDCNKNRSKTQQKKNTAKIDRKNTATRPLHKHHKNSTKKKPRQRLARSRNRAVAKQPMATSADGFPSAGRRRPKVQGLTHGVGWKPVGPFHGFTPWRV